MSVERNIQIGAIVRPTSNLKEFTAEPTPFYGSSTSTNSQCQQGCRPSRPGEVVVKPPIVVSRPSNVK